MSDNKSETQGHKNGLILLSEAQQRLSPRGRVAVNADLIQGKNPCFHDGMTVEDAVIITGLPHDEAARRIQEWRQDGNPDNYAALRLSQGEGEKYQAAPKTAKVLQFYLPFGKNTRAVSNPMARCALFAAVKERQYFKDYVVVGIVNGVKVEFAGEQLNQDDHDTLLQLVKMALHKPFGEDVCQSVNAVLSGLGRHTRQEQRAQLFEQISRLVRGTLRITPPNADRYEGHLLDDATTPENQKIQPRLMRHLSYRLNPKFAVFYSSTAYTLFDWQERVKLKGRGSELAKWLHLWIIGNAEQYAHKVETIRQSCGSRLKDLNEFRRNLRVALNLLKDAGIILSWDIDNADLVHIERAPSPAQLAHVAKKAAPASKPSKPRRRNVATRADELLPHLTPPKK
jgi:hypothetical protein